jgi:methyltransferase (TIGR00027 family)
MADSPITHVSDTAFWVATYRADEGERADALFHDPLAARLVEGRGRAIAAGMADAERLAWAIPIRTRMIDDMLAEAVAAGCDAVVNLGAGLDTRPYRLALPPSLQWIEVDFADTIAFKEERLAGETPRCRLRRVPLDLADAAARRALFDEIDAGARKVFVMTEGVVPYLANAEVAALADDLHARPHFAYWLLDYWSSRIMRLSRIHRRRRQQMRNAPLKFRPDDWTAFFVARGWRVKETRNYVDEAIRLRRPLPSSWRTRLLVKLLPRSVRQKMRQSFGYSVLERA